jgi:hypothetical protein
MTRPDINARPASEMEEQLLRGGWSSAIARQVTEGHSQCSPNAGGQIAVLLPEELPQLSPQAARALLTLLHNVAESDGRGARGSTRAA